MLEVIKAKLRGQHNSLRLKYFELPVGYAVEFLFFRLRGKKWIDFYKYRMEEKSKKSVTRSDVLDSSYVDDAKFQFDFLVENGLESGHRLLDFGCGAMRLRVWTEGSGVEYFGVDISSERIAKGLRTLQARGIEFDSNRAVVVSDYELSALKESSFDFIWAASVYTHMPIDEIVYSMICLKSHLAPTGKFIFTFSPSKENHVVRMNQKDWWHPPSVIKGCAERAGFCVSIVERWNNPKGGMAAILTLPSRT